MRPLLEAQRQHPGSQPYEWRPPHPGGSSNEPPHGGVAFLVSAARQRPKWKIMKPGDHVKVMGRDGFYVFLKEVQGTATLRVGGANGPDAPTLAIAINRVVSLETTELVKPENRRTDL
jgi:hypothetical protein